MYSFLYKTALTTFFLTNCLQFYSQFCIPKITQNNSTGIEAPQRKLLGSFDTKIDISLPYSLITQIKNGGSRVCELSDSNLLLGIQQIDTSQLKNLKNLNDIIVFYADSGNYDAVNFLLKKGISPNTTIEGGYTALMYASQNGHLKIAKLLIDHGADVNLIPYDGNSALFAAVRSNNDSIAELLLENGAGVNLLNENALSPLHYAAGYGFPYLVDLLLYFGSTIDTSDYYGNTPLMVSIYSGATQTSTILINAGANVNKTDIYGNSPMMVAAQFNDTLLIRKLFTAGADINKTNYRMVNALSFAIQNNSIEACKLLLDLGISVNNNELATSYYQHSIEANNKEITSLLKERDLKKRLKPNIGSVNIYSGLSFNQSDFMYEFGGGIFEPISKTMFSVGYKYRPFSSRIIEYRDNEFYQFWEKRYSILLSLQHFQELKKGYIKGNFGYTFGLNGELTWNNLHGSRNDLTKAILAPSIGLYYQRNFYTLVGKWEIANYKSEGISFNRFGVQFLICIPNKKNRVINKNISWLN